MIKQEIIEKISRYFKLTYFEAEQIYDDTVAYMAQGIKEDNIAEITNLGEFISKRNDLNENEKTVEFIPATSFEDNIRDESTIYENRSWQQPVSPTHEESSAEVSLADDELRKEREETVNKISTPLEEYRYDKPQEHKSSLETFITPGVISQSYENTERTIEPEKPAEQEVPEEKNELQEIPQKSFSDFFSEVKATEDKLEDKAKQRIEEVTAYKQEIPPPVEPVIPVAAVNLHNEITGSQNENISYQPSFQNTSENQAQNTMSSAQNTVDPPVYSNGSGNDDDINTAQDTSYYIWYKDSIPNVNDTQTMSYEYELLYQATKEAEYKSKLRIYVSTFIIFFSVVLLLLIFSPVIYKYFFTPKEEQLQEERQEEESVPESSDNTQPPASNNTSTQNTPPVTDQNQQPTHQNTQQNTQENTQQQTTQQNTQQTSTQQETTENIPGLTKNSIGWADDKNKVVYVKTDNGKFTIQESSWDSEAKANKRLGVIGSLIPGLKGTVTVSDLGAKGKWYRAMVGEFASVQEAKSKAEEIRKKEGK